MPPRKKFDAPDMRPICACRLPQVRLSATARVSCGSRKNRSLSSLITKEGDTQTDSGTTTRRWEKDGSQTRFQTLCHAERGEESNKATAGGRSTGFLVSE